ncbi:hypothetical protein GCM10009539_69400 [Cryptosporangium japonicum]|uniref:Uncharacterized protein n=1 Tax=Cryptosporangium japonicum TaxID=80872 RepID=A0ABP3EP11_9ACTN
MPLAELYRSSSLEDVRQDTDDPAWESLMPVLLAPSRLTIGMIRNGFAAVARRFDAWTLEAFNAGTTSR